MVFKILTYCQDQQITSTGVINNGALTDTGFSCGETIGYKCNDGTSTHPIIVTFRFFFLKYDLPDSDQIKNDKSK